MQTAQEIIRVLVNEATAAKAYSQVWWHLYLADQMTLDVIEDSSYRDFFYTVQNAHYKLCLLTVAKMFDDPDSTSCFRALKVALAMENQKILSDEISARLSPLQGIVSAILYIRNRSLVHNESGITIQSLYQDKNLTGNDIIHVIMTCVEVVNFVANKIGMHEKVFSTDRVERSIKNIVKDLRMRP